jgi:hypothetical protein
MQGNMQPATAATQQVFACTLLLLLLKQLQALQCCRHTQSSAAYNKITEHIDCSQPSHQCLIGSWLLEIRQQLAQLQISSLLGLPY